MPHNNPYEWLAFVLAAVFMLLLLLIILKILLLLPKTEKKPTKSQYKYSSTQFSGDREYLTECFDVLTSANSLFAVLVSGNMNSRFGRNIAELVVEILKDEYMHELYRSASRDTFYNNAIEKVHKAIKDNVLEHNVMPAIVAFILEGDYMDVVETYGGLRGNSLYLCKDRRLNEITNRKRRGISSILVSRLKIMGDEVIMMASKGTSSSLTEMEIIGFLSRSDHPRIKCERMERLIQKKQLKNQDNVSIIVMEKMT